MHEIAVWERRFDQEEATNAPSNQYRRHSVTNVEEPFAIPVSDTGSLLDSMPRGSSPGGPGRDEDRNTSIVSWEDTTRLIGQTSTEPVPLVGPAGALEPPEPALERNSPSSPPEGTTAFEDSLLPCHYFDYMYGTSTGGLIATMLGRLRMNIPQCLKIYREVSDGLFGKKRSVIPLTTKYYHKPLEIAVKGIVKQYCKTHPQEGEDACDGEDMFPWSAELPDIPDVDLNQMCQAICLTAVHNNQIDVAYLLRSHNQKYYDIPNWTTPYNEGAVPLRIWQVTRATSAAPFYFKALQAHLHNEKVTFKDGGIRENNPSGAAFSEFVSEYGEGNDPALLLSVGTGRPNEDKDGFAAAWPGPLGNSTLLKKVAEKFAVLRNVLVKYTAGEEKHTQMLNTARGENTWYKRLNVSSGLEQMPLDYWKRGPWTDPATGETAVVPGGATLTEIEEVTKEYLARERDLRYDSYAAPKEMLVHVAEKLVRQRRAREAAARDGDSRRWDAYMGKWLSGKYENSADEALETVEVTI